MKRATKCFQYSAKLQLLRRVTQLKYRRLQPQCSGRDHVSCLKTQAMEHTTRQRQERVVVLKLTAARSYSHRTTESSAIRRPAIQTRPTLTTHNSAYFPQRVGEMNTGQSEVMLRGWEVKVHSILSVWHMRFTQPSASKNEAC